LRSEPDLKENRVQGKNSRQAPNSLSLTMAREFQYLKWDELETQ